MFIGERITLGRHDPLTDSICDDIHRYIVEYMPHTRLAILFGSGARGEWGADIDFKIILDREPTTLDRRQTAEFARVLHYEHGLEVAVEPGIDVALETKIICSMALVAEALNLTPFLRADGGVEAIPIPHGPGFLLSRECQMRTMLSALTTPNILVYGNLEKFGGLCEQAFVSIAYLVSSTWRVSVDCGDKLVDLMITHPTGAVYKQYLGYQDLGVIRRSLKAQWKALKLRTSEGSSGVSFS